MAEELAEAGGKARLYVTGDLGEGVAVALDEGPAHYLLHVLRAREGNRVALFNGRDGEWLAEITMAAKRGVVATCGEHTCGTYTLGPARFCRMRRRSWRVDDAMMRGGNLKMPGRMAATQTQQHAVRTPPQPRC